MPRSAPSAAAASRIACLALLLAARAAGPLELVLVDRDPSHNKTKVALLTKQCCTNCMHADLVHHRFLPRLRPFPRRARRWRPATGSSPPPASPRQLADLVAEYGDAVLPVALDVTDPAAVQAALRQGVDRFGRLDVVVNNAGYANVAPIETAAEEDFRAQFETNFWGVYNVSQGRDPAAARAGRRHCRAVLVGRRPGRRLAGDRQLPGRQVRRRRVQPGARGRDGAVRRARSWSSSRAGSGPTGRARR